MNLFNEIERVTKEYTIDPRVYKLFTKLSPQQQADFLKDMLKIQEESHEKV